MSEKKLADKLTEHLRKTGALSSADIGAFARTEEDLAPEPPKGEALGKDTELPAIDPGEFDGANRAAEKAPAAEALRSDVRDMGAAPAGGRLAGSGTVKITPADKESFISAVIADERMRMTFNVCGGRIPVVIRNRTLPETRAIIAQLRHELDTGLLVTNLDYTSRLRAMLMAAQVEELGGVAYPTLESETPLRRTQGKDGVAEPGWLAHADDWGNRSEGVHGFVWQCVWEFESKYWAMVEDAKNQDFWSPEASTSE